MKKFSCILLCLCMLIPLAACGGEKQITQESDLENSTGTDTEQNTENDSDEEQNDGETVTNQEPDLENSAGADTEQNMGNDSKPEDWGIVSNENEVYYKMKVAENLPGCPAMVDDPNRSPDILYAYDEQGALYRLKCGLEGISPGMTLYVTCFDNQYPYAAKDDDWDGEGYKPDYIFLPGAIFTEKAWELRKIADAEVAKLFEISAQRLSRGSFSMYKLKKEGVYQFSYTLLLGGIKTDDVLRLILDKSGNIIESNLDERDSFEFLKYIDTDVEKAIPKAMDEIRMKSGKYDMHFSFEIEEDTGDLNLYSEMIVHLDKDDPRYDEYDDHIHNQYRVRIARGEDWMDDLS